MTILHVTDFHFNQRWFDWLLNEAPAADLVVMSGDLLDLSGATPHQKQIEWVSGWIREFNRPISICSGNHDLEWNSESERWSPAYWLRDLASPNIWTDGQHASFDGLTLHNIGCTTRPKGSAADVWVVHAPPAKTLVSARASGGDGGDPDLIAPVKRYAPRLVLSGHVHTPVHWAEHGEQTLYLNPGYNADAPFPNHIFIRTDQMSCRHVTAARPDALTRERSSLADRVAQPEAVATTAV